MRKNLEFWQKIGLSFEILGVLAKLSFDENVEKKPEVPPMYVSTYSRMRVSIPKHLPEQTHFGWGTATQNGMGFTKIVVKQL